MRGDQVGRGVDVKAWTHFELGVDHDAYLAGRAAAVAGKTWLDVPYVHGAGTYWAWRAGMSDKLYDLQTAADAAAPRVPS